MLLLWTKLWVLSHRIPGLKKCNEFNKTAFDFILLKLLNQLEIFKNWLKMYGEMAPKSLLPFFFTLFLTLKLYVWVHWNWTILNHVKNYCTNTMFVCTRLILFYDLYPNYSNKKLNFEHSENVTCHQSSTTPSRRLTNGLFWVIDIFSQGPFL